MLRSPNRYQTPAQFFETWMISKLLWGNTYVLKDRDARGVVTALYVLDPCRVKPLVSPEGAVYYELQTNELAGIGLTGGPLVVPAREIIHDRWNCAFHPLVGLVAALCLRRRGVAGERDPIGQYGVLQCAAGNRPG